MATVVNIPRFGIPPPPPHLVDRGRLTELIEACVNTYRLVLVSAPAGYGKTTALAIWARETTVPVAWLTIEPSDNDLERFLRRLLAVWETVDPGIAERPAGLLLGSAMPDVDAALQAMIDEATSRAEPMAIVLDDYHVTTNQAVHDAVVRLVEHVPPHVHVVIGSRNQPPLPLARYHARQQMREIGPAELGFQRDEVNALLNGALSLELPGETVTTIIEQVEGWVAAVQLVAITLRGDRSSSPMTVTGRHRFITDFFREEVLASLDITTREFLVVTSIVDRISAPLATALTGDAHAQETLEQLERSNLFTQPLDDTREWYRYHRLFADMLHAELEKRPAEDVSELHRRAARWYLENEHPDAAFEHAMAAKDIPLVTDVLDRFAQVKMFSGQIATLRRWMHAIPAEWFSIEPNLDIFRAGVLFFTGQMDACVECLDGIEHVIRSVDHPMPVADARLTAMRCFIACAMNDLDQAQAMADLALQTLVPADESFRGGVLGALGDTYRRNGYWKEAHAYYLLSLQHIDNPEGHIQSLHGFGGLADLELRQGHLRSAAAYWRRAIAKLDDSSLWGVYPLPLIGWIHTRHGEILYEWNDLEAAQDACDRGRERSDLGGDPRSIIANTVLTARLHLATGDHDEAGMTIDRARPISLEAQFPAWTSELERCQVELWLAQGKLRTAVEWADDALARGEHNQPDREPTAMAVARLLIVMNDTTSIDRALELLDRLVEQSISDGRAGLRIAALSLQALALRARGDDAKTFSALEPALRLAEPEGYVRTFVDLGLPMARLLQEARARKIQPGYVDMLLSAFDASVVADLPAGTALPEPLSPRERDVLQRIASGLTNREIADDLYISAETVKKHTGSIYGKLGVRGRTEAVARARNLNLLD